MSTPWNTVSMPFKSCSRRELDRALLHGKAQEETLSFQSFSSHNSTVNRLSLQQLICKGKQKPEITWACLGKQPPEEILGCASNILCTREKIPWKQARRFWSSCQHRSVLIWDCAPAWGHEKPGRNQMQLQEQRATRREKGLWAVWALTQVSCISCSQSRAYLFHGLLVLLHYTTAVIPT